MKKKTTLSIEEEVIEAFRKTGQSMSQFCEDCMRAYAELQEEGLGHRIQAIDDEIRKLEYQRWLVASRFTQDFERKQEILDKLPEYWKDFTDKAEEYYVGIVPVEEFDDFRRLTGFAKRDLMDLAEYLYETSENDPKKYGGLILDFKHCIKSYNDEHDRIIRGDIL